MDIKKTYTKEEIIVAASFCKDLEDFKTRYQGIYEFIEGSDQLDKMFSYEPVTLNRAVYVFEFSNGTAYAGLSYNIQRRYRSHVTEGNSPVYNYIRTRPNIKFQFKQLSEYMPADAAARLEIETIRDYRTKGWAMLNTLDGGGLGARKKMISRFFGMPTEKMESTLVQTDSELATDYTKINVTTGEAYFSPTKQEYLMPNEVVKAKINNVWVEQPFQDIKEAMLINDEQKVQCYCNHCNDRESQTPSAFLYNDFKGFFHLECTNCKNKMGKQYSWREYPISNAIFSQNDNLYEIKVISNMHITPHKVGKERFFSSKEASFAYQYIKKTRFFTPNCSINYLSDPDLLDGIPKYELRFENDEINIKYPLAKIDVQDNEFIDNYIDKIFGEYSEFIKNWLALYTYTNYETLPVLVLVGNRATGKNTFTQMVCDILPQLWAQWNGDRESSNRDRAKKLLWIDENSIFHKKNQYDEIKYLIGKEYVTVNEKFQPKYQVRNNIKIILTTNDFKPLAVKNEEIPTSEKDNNFFFYQFPPLKSLDRTMGEQLQARIGYYCRTELRRRYQEIINNEDESCRYFIPCPITAFSKEIYVSAKTDLDLATDDLQEFVERRVQPHIKYTDISNYLKNKGLLRNGLSVKHFISILQKRKIIGTDVERNSKQKFGYRIFRQKDIFDDSFTEKKNEGR